MCPTDYYNFDPNFRWNSPARVPPGDALHFLGIVPRYPPDCEEVEYLIQRGFSFKALDRLDSVIHLGEPLLWDDIIEPDFLRRLAEPDRLTALESARAYNLTLCWLLVLQAFRSDVSAREFMLKRNGLPPGMTAIECAVEGGQKRGHLMESLTYWAKHDWIEPNWFPFKE